MFFIFQILFLIFFFLLGISFFILIFILVLPLKKKKSFFEQKKLNLRKYEYFKNKIESFDMAFFNIILMRYFSELLKSYYFKDKIKNLIVTRMKKNKLMKGTYLNEIFFEENDGIELISVKLVSYEEIENNYLQKKEFKESKPDNIEIDSEEWFDFIEIEDSRLCKKENVHFIIFISFNSNLILNLSVDHLILKSKVKILIGEFKGPILVSLPSLVSNYKIGISMLKGMKYKVMVSMSKEKKSNYKVEKIDFDEKWSKDIFIEPNDDIKKSNRISEKLSKLKKSTSISKFLTKIIKFSIKKKYFFPKYQLQTILLPKMKKIEFVIPKFNLFHTYGNKKEFKSIKNLLDLFVFNHSTENPFYRNVFDQINLIKCIDIREIKKSKNNVLKKSYNLKRSLIHKPDGTRLFQIRFDIPNLNNLMIAPLNEVNNLSVESESDILTLNTNTQTESIINFIDSKDIRSKNQENDVLYSKSFLELKNLKTKSFKKSEIHLSDSDLFLLKEYNYSLLKLFAYNFFFNFQILKVLYPNIEIRIVQNISRCVSRVITYLNYEKIVWLRIISNEEILLLKLEYDEFLCFNIEIDDEIFKKSISEEESKEEKATQWKNGDQKLKINIFTLINIDIVNYNLQNELFNHLKSEINRVKIKSQIKLIPENLTNLNDNFIGIIKLLLNCKEFLLNKKLEKEYIKVKDNVKNDIHLFCKSFDKSTQIIDTISINQFVSLIMISKKKEIKNIFCYDDNEKILMIDICSSRSTNMFIKKIHLRLFDLINMEKIADSISNQDLYLDILFRYKNSLYYTNNLQKNVKEIFIPLLEYNSNFIEKRIYDKKEDYKPFDQNIDRIEKEFKEKKLKNFSFDLKNISEIKLEISSEHSKNMKIILKYIPFNKKSNGKSISNEILINTEIPFKIFLTTIGQVSLQIDPLKNKNYTLQVKIKEKRCTAKDLKINILNDFIYDISKLPISQIDKIQNDQEINNKIFPELLKEANNLGKKKIKTYGDNTFKKIETKSDFDNNHSNYQIKENKEKEIKKSIDSPNFILKGIFIIKKNFKLHLFCVKKIFYDIRTPENTHLKIGNEHVEVPLIDCNILQCDNEEYKIDMVAEKEKKVFMFFVVC